MGLKIYAKLSTLSTELAVNTVDRRVDLWITYGFVHNYVHRGGIRSWGGKKRKRIAREYSEICQKEKRKKFTYNVNFTGERKLQYLYKYNHDADVPLPLRRRGTNQSFSGGFLSPAETVWSKTPCVEWQLSQPA